MLESTHATQPLRTVLQDSSLKCSVPVCCGNGWYSTEVTVPLLGVTQLFCLPSFFFYCAHEVVVSDIIPLLVS